MPRPHAIDAPGTAEEEWRSWRAAARAPGAGRQRVVRASWSSPRTRTTRCSAPAACWPCWRPARARLRLVAITDGEASHPGLDRAAAGRLAERRGRPRRRRRCGGLGAAAEIVRLRIPDTGVSAAGAGGARRRCSELVPGFPAVPGAVGRVTCTPTTRRRGARRAAHARRRASGLLCYPIWTWHWAHPRDSRVPWEHAMRVPLSAAAIRRKRAAIGCFTSQLRPRGPQRPPVLSPEVIAHFVRNQEVLIS